MLIQAPIFVWLDGTIIEIISTILWAMCYSFLVFVFCYDYWWLCMVIKYHTVALYLQPNMY